MKLEELKEKIESETLSDDVLVIVANHSNFIAHQYIHQIAKIKGKDIIEVDGVPRDSMFEDFEHSSHIYLSKVEKVESFDNVPNHIVWTEKISKKCVNNYVVEIPKLEDWQFTWYAKDILSGVNEKKVEELLKTSKDFYRLDSELSKVSIFPKAIQGATFDEFIGSGAIESSQSKTVFDFCNALLAKDVDGINEVYRNMHRCDIDPVGFSTIMFNNIRNVINVLLQSYPNEENTGLKSGQIYAIKRYSRCFTRESLLKTFKIIASLDEMLKTGRISDSMILDYLVTAVLTA